MGKSYIFLFEVLYIQVSHLLNEAVAVTSLLCVQRKRGFYSEILRAWFIADIVIRLMATHVSKEGGLQECALYRGLTRIPQP